MSGVNTAASTSLIHQDLLSQALTVSGIDLSSSDIFGQDLFASGMDQASSNFAEQAAYTSPSDYFIPKIDQVEPMNLDSQTANSSLIEPEPTTSFFHKAEPTSRMHPVASTSEIQSVASTSGIQSVASTNGIHPVSATSEIHPNDESHLDGNSTSNFVERLEYVLRTSFLQSVGDDYFQFRSRNCPFTGVIDGDFLQLFYSLDSEEQDDMSFLLETTSAQTISILDSIRRFHAFYDEV
ncbi:hypothetical protein TNIN_3761 [Trichonephila inaurata madagascariensis]|uniref:Uncharacterized protein n=1 Tax=Trichonephila inaurata madagascariensis TaxID=2747483 RepID=A0A8X6WT44_9ARAC|nr:hypothetical protein TNIN_3761 [Trichonephila inaurata madagascariensis]